MTIFVTKFDGTRQPYNRRKILRTCLRTGISREKAESIVRQVESHIYDGIRTKEILKMTLKLLEKEDRTYSSKYILRQALSELDPRFSSFEKFVELLFKEQGYKTWWNQIVQGKTIEHQIDVVVEKGDAFLIEVKHHRNPHRFCGLGVILQNWARLLDIRDKTDKYKNIWIVTNTKFSDHAIKFAKAKGIFLMGWKHPHERGLETIIDRKAIYPVTVLKTKRKIKERLLSEGIIQVFQIISESDKLKKLFSKTTVKNLQEQARGLCCTT